MHIEVSEAASCGDHQEATALGSRPALSSVDGPLPWPCRGATWWAQLSFLGQRGQLQATLLWDKLMVVHARNRLQSGLKIHYRSSKSGKARTLTSDEITGFSLKAVTYMATQGRYDTRKNRIADFLGLPPTSEEQAESKRIQEDTAATSLPKQQPMLMNLLRDGRLNHQLPSYNPLGRFFWELTEVQWKVVSSCWLTMDQP